LQQYFLAVELLEGVFIDFFICKVVNNLGLTPAMFLFIIIIFFRIWNNLIFLAIKTKYRCNLF
jgi:hypothetical protein